MDGSGFLSECFFGGLRNDGGICVMISVGVIWFFTPRVFGRKPVCMIMWGAGGEEWGVGLYE